ncbi:MAG: hypothetical protein K5799_09140 [Erythrobacter sp.]|nr:hypothetical protein [Erythrobacter sp.]
MIGKVAAVSLVASLALGCEEAPPSGQIIARVAGTDVTEREVDQELRSAGIALASAGPKVRDAAAERIVQRKILAAEALRRDLDREGVYHFALRRARDELLAQALQRRVRYQARRPDDGAVADEIASRPWAYSRRRLVRLAGPAGAETPRNVEIDTADAPPDTAAELVASRVGDVIAIEGQEWNVIGVQPVALDETTVTDLARKALVERSVDAELARLVDQYRQSGQVQYQEGKGASAQSRD